TITVHGFQPVGEQMEAPRRIPHPGVGWGLAALHHRQAVFPGRVDHHGSFRTTVKTDVGLPWIAARMEIDLHPGAPLLSGVMGVGATRSRVPGAADPASQTRESVARK